MVVESSPDTESEIDEITEEITMPAPERNKFWTMRSSHGTKPKFDNPEILMRMCVEYFEWVQANPLKEHKQYHYQGELTNGVVAKMRAMTVKGLCIFLDISTETWRNYCKKVEEAKLDAEVDIALAEGFIGVTTRVREIIDTQKFEGAAADLLNPNIIARDLGLKDARELSGPGGGPVEIDHAESARQRLRGKLIPEEESQ